MELGGQVMQEEAFTQTVPESHGLQSDAPELAEKVPGAQVWQLCEEVFRNVPTEQGCAASCTDWTDGGATTALVTPASKLFVMRCSEATRDAENEAVLLRALTMGTESPVVVRENCTTTVADTSRRDTTALELILMLAELTLRRVPREDISVAFSAGPNEDAPAREMDDETVVCMTLIKPDGLTVQAIEPADGADDPAGQLWQD